MTSWAPADLLALELSGPPEPSISGVGYPGTLTLVYSEPEGLKSWLELIVCLEAIRAGRSVLWVDFEMDGRSVVARLRDLGATDDEIRDFGYVQPTDPLTDQATRAHVEALMQEQRPAVVVVDAMAGCLALHGLSQNEADDIERLYSIILRPFRVEDAALRIIDHVIKDRETRGRWPTGSQRKLGAADVGLSLELVRPFSRGHTGLARIRVQKDRLGGLARPHCAELTLTSDPESGRITWTITASTATDEPGEASARWRPTELMRKVSEYVARQEEPISRNAIEKARLGRQASYVRAAIDALVADGCLAEATGGRGARLYTHVKPFTSSTSSTSSDLVSLRPDELAVTSSDLVYPLQGDEVTDEDEVGRIWALYGDEVA